MEKKNPYKFTLGFDKTKPTHARAVEILNAVRDKADLIASAVVSCFVLTIRKYVRNVIIVIYVVENVWLRKANMIINVLMQKQCLNMYCFIISPRIKKVKI